MNCTICKDEIHGTTIGDGDGTGQRFAHRVCYVLRDLLREAAPWCPESIRDRILLRARREGLEVTL